jgi:hypothetical protein
MQMEVFEAGYEERDSKESVVKVNKRRILFAAAVFTAMDNVHVRTCTFWVRLTWLT